MSNTTKILIVDDEPNILVALDFLLQRKGFVTQKAENGLEALALAPQFGPHLVVLDVMMPGMDGFEVAQRLRQLPDMADVRIVFLTAKGTLGDKEMGYKSGADYYLTKPFDNDTFIQTIEEIVTYG
jgi:DNA-binding response OmpR family regulator